VKKIQAIFFFLVAQKIQAIFFFSWIKGYKNLSTGSKHVKAFGFNPISFYRYYYHSDGLFSSGSLLCLVFVVGGKLYRCHSNWCGLRNRCSRSNWCPVAHSFHDWCSNWVDVVHVSSHQTNRSGEIRYTGWYVSRQTHAHSIFFSIGNTSF
jgi:hypothetical protein